MRLPAYRSGRFRIAILTADAQAESRSILACATFPDMQSVATSLSIGTLLLFTQAQEPNQDSRIIHLGKITCRTFTEFTRQEQDIIMAWLHGYYLPEHDPPVMEIEKLWSDRAKLAEHCVRKPNDDVMTGADALLGK